MMKGMESKGKSGPPERVYNLSAEQLGKVGEVFEAHGVAAPRKVGGGGDAVDLGKLFANGFPDILYCLSAGLLLYGIAGIATPVLSSNAGFVWRKLACVGVLNLYGLALLASVALLALGREIFDDAVFLLVLSALFFCARGVALEVMATNRPDLTLLAGVLSFGVAMAEYRFIVGRLKIGFRGALWWCGMILLTWNFLAPAVFGAWIGSLADARNVKVQDSMRALWMFSSAVLAVAGILFAKHSLFPSGGDGAESESTGGDAPFLLSPGMAWTFASILLAGSVFHHYVLTYAFNVFWMFSDFSLFALFACVAALGAFPAGASPKKKGGSTPAFTRGEAARLFVALIPLSAVLVARALDAKFGVPASFLGDIGISTVFQVLSAGVAMVLVFRVKKWRFGDLLAMAHIIVLAGFLNAGWEVGAFDPKLAGLAFSGTMLYLALKIRHPLPAYVGVTALSLGIGKVHRVLDVAEGVGFAASAMPWLAFGIGSYAASIAFRKRVPWGFAFAGNAIFAVAALFLGDGALTMEWMFVASLSLFVFGWVSLVVRKEFPGAFPLFVPLPCACVRGMGGMGYWHLVVLGFILLGFGVVSSLHRKGGMGGGLARCLGLDGVKWNVSLKKRVKIGAFELALLIVFAILVILGVAPVFKERLVPARRISCANNLKQIGLALRMYSNVYDGEFPPLDGVAGLDILRKEGFLENPRVYVCPGDTRRHAAKAGEPLTENTVSFRYNGGHSEDEPSNTIIAYDKPGDHDRFGNVLFLDGHVKGFAGGNWLEVAEGE